MGKVLFSIAPNFAPTNIEGEKIIDESHTAEATIRQQQKEDAENNMEYVKGLLSKKDLSDSDVGDLQGTAQNLRKQSFYVGWLYYF